MKNSILEMREITKQTNDIRVLNAFSLQVKQGDIHAVVSDNHESISAMIKVLCGIYPHESYSGDILINGNRKIFNSIKDSEEAGIGVIYQKPFFCKSMSITQNLFLGNEYNRFGFIDQKRCQKEAERIIADLNLDFKKRGRIFELSLFEKQKLAIGRNLIKNSGIWVLEDIISVLTEEEIDDLLDLLQAYGNKGITIVYVGHRLKDILRIADTVTVMQNGKDKLSEAAKNYMEDDLRISMIIKNELPKYGSLDSFCANYDISRRENEVLLLLIDGKSYKEICDQLFLSLNTVKKHVSNIYQKIKVNSKRELLNAILKYIKN
ncbi:MAG: hypothetical protein A2Z99_14455 [Treponema sp. GWB1_62_6]|nr:MAG: hypothetical protein A2Y36_16660 [Treponema sp. GWA1_62_8]OHE64767.1 MAG: hypothetical protein A2001_04440 [Treponema sp. GWC1_61_84]OHE68010.1 MAG: hypothetical protein A2413_09980 [Treponema sp. RIFOXYC1_FULL_61_9]OHE70515.1 MAG: hypothetical protein A2Z99_14455 [Treponema sp. GWB1_62_6]HCM27610.1 hypothetical protein [Treponema sp.]